MCPAHVDVPAYIALVGEGDYAGAINMIRKDNPFPTACAFVCEHPCEERCRRTLIDAPINIRGIKKFEDLPENARHYVEFAEKHLGVPVCMVSNGPAREDIMYR